VNTARPLRSLYVCYLSLEDPLVESQVMAYLEGLARHGHTIHLLTFETGRLTRSRRRGLRGRTRARGVHWHGLRYHKRPSLPATALDALSGAFMCAWLLRRHRLDAVHARSHVPAAMSMLAARLAPHELIFDIRGLMAEEYVDLGRWHRGGLAFRITKRAERAAIRRAAGIVVLTERVRRLRCVEQHRGEMRVIPCCADVDRLAAAGTRRATVRQRLGVGARPVLAYVGKLGGWYMDAEMVDFVAAARAEIPGLFFLVLTQGDSNDLERRLTGRGITSSDYALTAVEHARLGDLLAAADAAIALIRPVPSKVASSPTKIGECLAAGLPVVATDIGDVKSLLQRSRSGLILDDFSTAAYREAARELASMLADPATAGRCVATADEHLSLEGIGIPRYDSLYRAVARTPRACPGCGATSARSLSRFREVGLVHCRACGLNYAGATPSDDELAACYANYPVEETIAPATVARLEELVRSFAPYRQLGTLLDVGAGSGHLLIAAAREGWAAHAVEPGPRQRKRLAALGFPVHESPSLEDRSFDVVVLQETIEHMRDPASELREVARILRPGGLLYVTCPNFGSMTGRLLGPRSRIVAYPEHLNYFTSAALRGLAARCGFAEVGMATTGLSITDLRTALVASRDGHEGFGQVAGDGHRNFDELVRAGAMRSPALDALRHAVNAVLTVLELGDTIKGRFERPAA